SSRRNSKYPYAMPPMGTLISRGHGTEDGGVRIMNKLIPALFLLSLLDDRAHAECTIMDDGQQTYTVCWNGLAWIRSPVVQPNYSTAPRTPMSGPGMSNVGMSNMGGVSAFNY
ncbi:MAG: hypothetical protein WCF64_14890, partial [Methylocella sp.]